MMMLIWLLVFVLLVKLAIEAAGRVRLGRPGEHDAELARLREEVDRLSTQVGRLEDEQSFMVKLLSEGTHPQTSLPLPPPTAPDEVEPS